MLRFFFSIGVQINFIQANCIAWSHLRLRLSNNHRIWLRCQEVMVLWIHFLMWRLRVRALISENSGRSSCLMWIINISWAQIGLRVHEIRSSWLRNTAHGRSHPQGIRLVLNWVTRGWKWSSILNFWHDSLMVSCLVNLRLINWPAKLDWKNRSL
jgi:hypothetical protein